MEAKLSLEDKLAIHEVIARYSYTWDAKDPDGFALLFTEDGVWELVAPGDTIPQIRSESRPAIRTMALEDFQGRLAGVITRHHQTGLVFDALGVDSARTCTMVLVTRQEASDAVPRLSHTGVYDDQWRKTQAGWQFVVRTFRPDRSMSRTAP